MKQKFKRGLSLIIACVMILALLPTAVFAEGGSGDNSSNEINAGYFVLLPEMATTDKTSSNYLPYAEESTTDRATVDVTTGYIGYITEAAKTEVDAVTPDANGTKRLAITSADYNTYLTQPTDYGQLEEKWGIQDGQNYEIVWYEINNSGLSSKWPEVAAENQDGTRVTSAGYHVDGYVQGVAINVLYNANYPIEGDESSYEDTNDGNLKSGDSYRCV